MKERLTNNLGLKILAIFLAFFLWLIVSNVSNPVKQDYKEVAVDIINDKILEENNLTYEVVGKSTVTVYYDVHTLDAYKIKSSDFYAYADLSELYDVTGSIPIKVEMVANKGLINGTPTTRPGVIQIKTEEIQEKTFDLTAHTKGDHEKGYAVGEITLTPDVITATGAVSAIGKINSIGVEIPMEGANADFTGVAKPVFYDANKNSIEVGDDVTLDSTEITYQVTMLKVKDLALDFQVRGSVADGYRFTGVESDIKNVSVEGMKASLASLSTLVIPGEYLNMDGATKDVVVQVDLAELLPENVTLAGNDPVIANITMKVEPLEIRGFRVDLADAVLEGASEDLKYEFNAGSIQVDIEGLTEDLDVLDEAAFQPVIDVTDFEEGVHKGSVKLTVGEGFNVVNTEGFEITVTAVDPSKSSTSPEDNAGEHEKELSKDGTKESLDSQEKEAKKASDERS